MPFEIKELKGLLYRIEKLYWAHNPALLFIEGGAVQTLIGPSHLFIQGTRSEPYDPRPHLREVILATISEAPDCMDLLEAFSVIRHQSC